MRGDGTLKGMCRENKFTIPTVDEGPCCRCWGRGEVVKSMLSNAYFSLLLKLR